MMLSVKATRGVVALRKPHRALTAGLAGLAMAPATDSTVAQLEGVTVTASAPQPVNALTKLPAELNDIPQSVTVLSPSLLQSQGVSSLADALRDVPGITIGGAEGAHCCSRWTPPSSASTPPGRMTRPAAPSSAAITTCCGSGRRPRRPPETPDRVGKGPGGLEQAARPGSG